jgi:hypothetical protein
MADGRPPLQPELATFVPGGSSGVLPVDTTVVLTMRKASP